MSYASNFSPSALEVAPGTGQLEPTSHLYEGLEVSTPPHATPPLHSEKDEILHIEESPRGLPNRVGNMKATTFWLIISVICIVVIGAAVGGSVGGTIAARRNNTAAVANAANSPTTSTNSVAQTTAPTTASNTGSTTGSTTGSNTASSTASNTAATSSATFTPTTDCPTSNLTAYNSMFLSGDSGTVVSGAALNFQKFCGFKGSNLNNIGESFVTTFDDCIETCASINFWAGNSSCYAAAFTLNGNRPGNCWAQSKEGTVSGDGLTYTGSIVDNIAVLVT
ncbi:hypothetical protein OIDMADRAFT_51237 [Oidiodendron maius Zn]|uniref:Apple domain-containing protein n=1 Tax=Oidiodendron maius (strain Zn) TaxID=913774 RepID=A0A0C3HAZ9_OIDMZ|nr:hypothetical protein OIDMADRAFT_51237 [Oidiodendron maius Zn]